MKQAENSIREGKYEAAKEILNHISSSEDIKRRIEKLKKDADKVHEPVRREDIVQDIRILKNNLERAKLWLEWIAMIEEAVATVVHFEETTAFTLEKLKLVKREFVGANERQGRALDPKQVSLLRKEEMKTRDVSLKQKQHEYQKQLFKIWRSA